MNYNTTRKKLIMPEYGRNIQNMADQILDIEDREKRNRAAQSLIDIMGNFFPYLRDIPDFKHKLWDHLAIMTEFKLDIDYPYELPTQKELKSKPNIVPYNVGEVKFRHYGKMVEMMIKEAANFPDGEEKNMLVRMIADHMKKAYLNWNKESVSDETIIKDFEILSGGKLRIPEGFIFSECKEAATPRNNNNNNNNNKKKQQSSFQSQNSKKNNGQQNQYRRY